jgi:hypothetical protein
MATFSLDNIRAAADAKYGSTDIEFGEGKTVKLLNPLRLPKAKRDALSDIAKRLESDTEDQVVVLQDALRSASETALVEELIEAIGDDLGVLMEIFTDYMEGTQAGEASASES